MQALSVLSVVLIIAALSLLFRLAEKIEEENRMLESGLETSRIYNEALQMKIGEIRRFRHDAAGLLQAIEGCEPDEGSGPAVRKAALPSEATASKAAMPLLEAVIELKRRQCAENDIEFVYPDSLFADSGSVTEVDDTAGSVTFPEETDLCLLLQNLLDNAYEANLRIDDSKQRMMSLDAEFVHSEANTAADAEHNSGTAGNPRAALAITVANRIDAQEKVSFFTRKSSAELHGIGLRIVDDILKKYNGKRSVSTDHENHVLTTKAVLHILR